MNQIEAPRAKGWNMWRRCAIGIVVAGSLLLLPACDNSDEAASIMLDEEPTATIDDATTAPAARLTTQQLLELPRVWMPLDLLPLRLKVPNNWKITHLSGGAIVMLEGPTPSGEAQIRLLDRSAIPAHSMEQILIGARRTQPGDGGTATVRTVGPAQVIERRTVQRPMNLPVVDGAGLPMLDEQGEPKMQTTTPMRWTITVLVQADKEAMYYELNFIDLSKEEYDVDRPFLEEILSTLQYTGPVSGTSAIGSQGEAATPSTEPAAQESPR